VGSSSRRTEIGILTNSRHRLASAASRTLEELIEELATTADELGPVIERGVAQKRLTYTWRKGEQCFALTTENYLAEKAAAAQRAADAVADWFDGEKPSAPGRISGAICP
jgi:hypothetical protein